MSEPKRPAYVDIPGEIVGTAPYRARGCLMQAMLLDGDRGAQQDLVDRLLVAPSGGTLALQVLTGKVMVAALYVDSMGSMNPGDAAKGVMREWDIGFWTWVGGGLKSDPSTWGVYCVPSFLFVDTATAMAAGREVFGYPKGLARWDRNATAPDDAAVALHVLHYPRFGPAERPREEVLVRVARSGTAPAQLAPLAPGPEFWAGTGLPQEVLGEMGLVPRGLTLAVKQLMLRQLRDARAPDQPCLQAACVVDVQADDFTEAGLLHGAWTVSLAPSASHPIAQTLGLQADNASTAGWWVRQDFTVPAATYLWQGAKQ